MDRISLRQRFGLALVVAIVAGGFAWYARIANAGPEVVVPAGSAIPVAGDADLYPLLARGFLRGHLFLDAAVPAESAGRSDVYDPGHRSGAYLHDVSLYRGRYYAYFGPAPALLLFAPFRLITGHDLSSTAAVVVFCTAAFAGLIALFSAAAGAEFAWRADWRSAAILLGLAGGSLLLPLLRRAAFYEVAIAAGAAAFVWAFYFAVRLTRAPGWPAAAGFSGILLGLAIASRPTYLVCVLPLAGAVAALSPPSERRRAALGAGAAVGAILVLLGLYNALRFGDPFEFGQRYQLSGAREGSLRHFSPTFLPHQAASYLFSALRFTPLFPYLHPPETAATPGGIASNEYVFGVLRNVPVLAFAVVAIAAAFGRPRRPNRTALLLLTAALAATLLPVLLYFGSCVRYLADFGPVLSVLACLGLVETMAWSRPRLGAWSARAACLIGAASLGIVFLAGVDMYHPAPAFDRLGSRPANPPHRAVPSRGANPEAAVVAGVTLVPGMRGRTFPLASTGRPGAGNLLLIAVDRAGSVRFGYDHWGKATIWSEPLTAAAGSSHRIAFWMPSILDQTPPAQLRVDWDGRTAWRIPVPYFRAGRDEVYLGRNPLGGTTCEPELIGARFDTPLR